MKRVYCPMIEKARADQIPEIAGIWLKSNICGQDFIPADYWNRHFESVKMMLPAAEIYVCSENNKISGFIGITDGKYVAGLFVLPEQQSNGVGRHLIEECQKQYPVLELDVYLKNSHAINFYLKNGFQIISEKTNEDTNEPEYRMIWKKE